jgi:uncharacterized protein (DUF58 family)
MLRKLLRHVLEGGYLFRAVRGFYGRRLTQRGRFLLWATVAVAFLGVDTRRAIIFIPFALAAPPLLLALSQLFRRAPRARPTGRIPARLTAGRELPVTITLEADDQRASGLLSVAWERPLPRGLVSRPAEAYAAIEPGASSCRLTLTLRAERRGRFELPSLGLARTDLFGLLRSRSSWLAAPLLLAYPRFFTLGELPLPSGRRYQPGGIPLASEVGDSLEFIGTREYREGDPPRKIDWRSWGRLGRPVVREYQEEYFSRIALVLDTYLPTRPGGAARARFEAAISVLASIAERFSRSDEVVDILAAGPDLYEVSTGRSLGYLDNVLDVLACLEPSSAPAFESLEPAVYARLERLTSLVAVLLEWDEPRRAFLRRVRALGVAVHVVLVHEAGTRLPWPPSAAEIGPAGRFTPAEVAARIASEETA